MIGDSENDILAGLNAGCNTILIGDDIKEEYSQTLLVQNLNEAVDHVLTKKYIKKRRHINEIRL